MGTLNFLAWASVRRTKQLSHHRCHLFPSLAMFYFLPLQCFNSTFTFTSFWQVEVVLHCAATVRFDENLSAAISMNVSSLDTILKANPGWLCSDLKVGAVASLLDLARGMNRLQAFVHVSTAYANCNRSRQEFALRFFSILCCPCYELDSSEATQTRASILPQLLQESMRFAFAYCQKFTHFTFLLTWYKLLIFAGPSPSWKLFLHQPLTVLMSQRRSWETDRTLTHSQK